MVVCRYRINTKGGPRDLMEKEERDVQTRGETEKMATKTRVG
jgi:hypothetical protein